MTTATMPAFDIDTGQFEEVAHYTLDADAYTVCKPRQAPYQCASFKSRSLWCHKTDNYFVWIHVQGRKELFLLYRWPAHEQTGDPLDVGEAIDDFKIDPNLYNTQLVTYLSQQQPYHAPKDGKRAAATAATLPKSASATNKAQKTIAAPTKPTVKKKPAVAPTLKPAALQSLAAKPAPTVKPVESAAKPASSSKPVTAPTQPTKTDKGSSAAVSLHNEIFGSDEDDEPLSKRVAASTQNAGGAASDSVVAEDDAGKEALEKMKKELEQERSQRVAAEDALQNQQRIHKNYQQRKQCELRKVRETMPAASSSTTDAELQRRWRRLKKRTSN